MFLTKTKVFKRITKHVFSKNYGFQANHQTCFWQKLQFSSKSPSMFLAKTTVFKQITKHVFSKNYGFQANHQACFWQKLRFSSKSPSMFLAKTKVFKQITKHVFGKISRQTANLIMRNYKSLFLLEVGL